MTMPLVTRGTPDILGVTPDAAGANVAVYSAHAEAIELCLFDGDGRVELQRITLPFRSGDVFHAHVAGVAEGARYGFRAHGRFAPDEGHRFNPSKLLIDPHALALDRVPRFDRAMLGQRDGDPGSLDDTDSASVMPKAIVTRAVVAPPGYSLTPWSRTVIYELHVRGFTKCNPDVPDALRGTFAGLAHPAAIAHLTALGVTAVEIMPPCAWIEERHLAERGLTNYWGYNSIAFLCPDPRLAPGGWAEVRGCVAALAAAGIEVLIDIVLNHTGEGDAIGPTLSLRGLDNASYFASSAQQPWEFANESGCGNTLALNRPASLRLAMDCLRAWAQLGGVHGFRFDLAPVLGRTDSGFDANAPLLQAIEQDPLLSRLKMIAEPWDIGWGGYQLGRFPNRWGEWNDRYRDDVRRFWRGDATSLGSLATRLAGSADLFAHHRGPSSSINFVTAHDGFALADVVSFTAKRNLANGEDNRDGTDENFSWNDGVEGPTEEPRVLATRQGDQRALLATVLLSRGTPMLSMGSEFGQTQGGNNNPYAQDNETTWLDWAKVDPVLLGWSQKIIGIRSAYEAFGDDAFLTGGTAGRHQVADVSWRRPDGAPFSPDDWNATPGDTMVMLLGGACPVCLVLHRGRDAVEINLPMPGDERSWRLLADSAQPNLAWNLDGITVTAHPRSVLVLAEQETGRRQSVDPDALDRLARAAGVAPEWWETFGTYHRVGDDTKRSVLKAMHLPADTTGEARDSLAMFAEKRDRRKLPVSLVRRLGETLVLPMVLADGLSPSTEMIVIALEDGSLRQVRAGAADAIIEATTSADGRPVRRWMVKLPALPMGRHRVWRENAPEAICWVTVAPQSCYLPPAISGGGRRFGVSAQLYTLRTQSDQGIGDFSTLRQLALATAKAGGAIVGLNPMHTLFASERGRASPYQPSDRRFLDPIYLDLPEVGGPDARALSALPAVSYRGVWALKAPALEARFLAEEAAPDAAFQQFINDGGTALLRFAVFEALSEARGGQSWHIWPEALRHPATAEVAEFSRAHAKRVRFHQYLQFLCDQQLAAAAVPYAKGGLEIGFIRDLAVGCAPDGAEAWAAAEMVGHHVSVGAPPDPFSSEGQVWGLPPPNPHLMSQNGYASFAGMLAANMRHAGGIRIDHALGLARLFWVPDGARGRDGTYVAYPFDDLLGQVALESVRAQALVIGEDLGTVPEGMREVLEAHDLLSYRVLLLEREGRGFKPSASYPARAIACVSTHDLPTIAGWLEGADVTERVALGQRRPEDAASDMGERDAEREALHAALGDRTGDVVADAHAFVAETACDLMYVQADDLSGELQAVNLPGTDQERPNWRRRLGVPLDELFTNAVAVPILDALRKARPPE